MYIDLVLCKHEGNSDYYLFYAPSFSNLVGLEVIVETKHGEAKAVVEDSLTIDPTDEKFKFILKLAGATKPLRKVVSKVKYYGFVYDDETEEYLNGIDNNIE